MDLKMTKFALLSEGKRYFFQYCVISTCGFFLRVLRLSPSLKQVATALLVLCQHAGCCVSKPSLITFLKPGTLLAGCVVKIPFLGSP